MNKVTPIKEREKKVVIVEVEFTSNVQRPEHDHQDTARMFRYPQYRMWFSPMTMGDMLSVYRIEPESGADPKVNYRRVRHYPIHMVASWREEEV